MILMFVGQLLPLLAFIVIDSFVKDVRIAIASAVLLAVGQLIYTYSHYHRFDWFILIDVALITALGGISVILKNDLFFKTKPAIVEAIMIIFMIFLIMSKDQFLVNYLGRMVPPGMTLRPEAIVMMKKMLVWMSVYVLVHIGAIMYTAYYSSRKVWAFVAGPGFYFAFVPVMAVVIVKAVRKRWEKKQELAAESTMCCSMNEEL